MRRYDRPKFEQNRERAEKMPATGDAELVEDSPSEPYWGIGPDGRGLNWAGRVLEEVRRALRVASGN